MKANRDSYRQSHGITSINHDKPGNKTTKISTAKLAKCDNQKSESKKY